ncbi:MAG: DUF3105 domain-containing protein [Chloroflexota bacterium]
MAKKTRRTFKRNIPGKQQNQARIPLWVWVAGGILIAVLLVIGLFYLGQQGPALANSGIEGVEVLPDPGRGHTEEDVHYEDDVPVGGVHSSAWQNCGIYAESIEEEPAVHSLEHGAVWIAYQPHLPTDQVDILRNLVRSELSRVREPLILLTPKPELEAPIVASAWRVRLELDDASDERLVEFVQRYQRGPFTPEPGAACTGGIGQPLN